MNGRPFTDDEVALIEQRYREGAKYRTLCREFDRPKGTLAGLIARAIAAERVAPRNDYFTREPPWHEVHDIRATDLSWAGH